MIFGWLRRLADRRKMERVFSRRPDPFAYETSPYETARFKAMAGCLGGRRYGAALEVGCAEGAFTAVLAERAGRVTAIDISPAALGRARARLRGRPVRFVESDARDWSPGPGERFDLIVLGDVLYYLDKPLVRGEFEALFGRVRSWLAPGGRLILAHAFASVEERTHRRGFRERFERLGLRLQSENALVGGEISGGVSCLISVMEDA